MTEQAMCPTLKAACGTRMQTGRGNLFSAKLHERRFRPARAAGEIDAASVLSVRPASRRKPARRHQPLRAQRQRGRSLQLPATLPPTAYGIRSPLPSESTSVSLPSSSGLFGRIAPDPAPPGAFGTGRCVSGVAMGVRGIWARRASSSPREAPAQSNAPMLAIQMKSDFISFLPGDESD